MHRLRIGGVRPASIDPQIAAVHPAQFLQLLDERCALRPSFRIALRPAHQHADLPHPLGLLRARRERPRSRAAEQRDELAPLQVIELHSVPSQGRIAGYRIRNDQSGGAPLCVNYLTLRTLCRWQPRTRGEIDSARWNMQMHQIRYFLALCEERSFTRAAKRCGVSQPSLTNAIFGFRK